MIKILLRRHIYVSEVDVRQDWPIYPLGKGMFFFFSRSHLSSNKPSPQKTTWGLCRQIAMWPAHTRDPLRRERYMGEFQKAMDYKGPCLCISPNSILDISLYLIVFVFSHSTRPLSRWCWTSERLDEGCCGPLRSGRWRLKKMTSNKSMEDFLWYYHRCSYLRLELSGMIGSQAWAIFFPSPYVSLRMIRTSRWHFCIYWREYGLDPNH